MYPDHSTPTPLVYSLVLTDPRGVGTLYKASRRRKSKRPPLTELVCSSHVDKSFNVNFPPLAVHTTALTVVLSPHFEQHLVLFSLSHAHTLLLLIYRVMIVVVFVLNTLFISINGRRHLCSIREQEKVQCFIPIALSQNFAFGWLGLFHLLGKNGSNLEHGNTNLFLSRERFHQRVSPCY